MAYGISAKNDSGEVIIDSAFEHYHFAGKAGLFSTTRVPALSGGTDTQHSPSSPTGLNGSQVNGHIFKYSLVARANSNSPAPMCFIKPSSTGSSAPYAAIVLVERYGVNWHIWILQTYGYTAPQVYCFLPLKEMTASAAASSDVYGLKTYNSAGDVTFNSSIRPLKVIGGGTATSPSLAHTGTSSGYSVNLSVNVSPLNFSTGVSGTAVSDMMYYCPSISHSCQEHQANSSGDGFQAQGSNSFFYSWGRGDLWWCFYRGAFRLSSSSNLQSSYVTYASGHVWKAVENTSGILVALAAAILAFATFGATLPFFAIAIGSTALTSAFTNTGVASGYYYPYKNDSRNNSNNPFMISKASYYD